MINKFRFFMSVAGLFTLTLTQAQVADGADATIKGTPYLIETYEEGQIFYANNNVRVPARYNVFKDLIEYQQNGRTLELDPTVTIKKVRLHNATFVVEKYLLNDKPKFGYFAVLDSGKVMLYSKKAISYVAPKKGGALDGSDQPGQFKKAPDTFYYKIGNSTLQEVKNIKSMIASFPDKQEELTLFAKKEKISPRKEEELVQLVRYYNSLE
jgi:hypothetical protein